MALSNESYIVYTDSAGEIIVPIKEAVPYLNIKLIGYQYYNYHEVMSQNIAEIVDDIKALQDGGLAQATFDLDQLIADANANINAQILGIESGINDQIIFLTDQAVSNTNNQLAAFNEILSGDQVTTFGIVGEVTNNTTSIGDSNSGIIKRLDTVETAVGDENSGIVQQVTASTQIVNDIALIVGDENSGMVEDIIVLDGILNTDITGLVPRVTTIETTIGDVNSGLVKNTQLNTDMIFGAGEYAGLLTIVGDNVSGIIKNVNDLRTELDAEVIDSDTRITPLENIVGDVNVGLVFDVNALQIKQSEIDSVLGATDAAGLRADVIAIEALDLQGVRDTLYTGDSSHTQLLADLRSDVDALDSSSTSATDDLTTEIELVDAKTIVNAGNIQTNTNNITTLNSTIYTTDTGLVDRVNNMTTTITTELLTYDDSGNDIIFTPSSLFNTKKIADDLDTSDIINQFAVYFGSVGNFLPNDEVGKAVLDNWIADTISSTGYKLTLEAHVANYLDATYNLDNIQDNTDAITLLNGTESTDGSVAFTANAYTSTLSDLLYHATTGSISIINGGDTIVGSTEFKIKEYDNNLQTTTVLDLQTQIDTLVTTDGTIQDDIKNQTEELQVEMVRYDTILPFLQTMFEYVNDPGSITNAQIQDIFSTVITKTNDLAATIVSQDFVFLFTDNGGSGNNTFNISIVLDRDLKFSKIDPTEALDDYLSIYRLSDNKALNGTLDDTITDGSGALVIESGIYLESLPAYVYTDPDALTDEEEILNIDSPNDTLIVRFATRDIFGQHRVREIPIAINA